MNSKTFSIGILSITGMILLVAQFLPVQPVMANTSIKDRGYSLVTTRASAGGDVIYVIRHNSGQIASFVWDPSKRAIMATSVQNLTDVFSR